MKKQIKIVSMMLVIFMVVATLSNIVLASSTIEQQIQTIGNGNQAVNADEVVNLGATIVTIMQTVRNSCCSSCIIDIRY